MPDTLSSHYVTLLAEVDKTISVIRSFWLEAKEPVEKRKHMNRINELLDQRNSLMRASAAAQTISSPK